MRFTLITCFLAMTRAQPSFLSCAQICSSIINLHYRPAGCDCSTEETTSRSLEMDDLGVYYEPAEVYALHRISFINPPIYIINPASKLKLQATAPKIVWKRKLSQKHKDSEIGNLNVEPNRRLSYLDIDIKNPVVPARTAPIEINNIDSVSEKDFADCVNLHRLVYPTLINNSQFLKNHDFGVKSSSSESEVMADINNKCNQSASIVKQSLQEIKNRWPKTRKSSNEMDLNSADYSSEMDSKRMSNVKGPTSEGYLLNSFEEQDTHPTENSSFTIISVPDNNNEYDVTKNALTHSRKLIEQENINFTANSPVITPTPLSKDFSEDWQINNFRFMHSVEQIDTTEALQNNDTPPVTKKSSFQFKNSFEVLKDSALNMDSKINNNQDQKDIPGEDNLQEIKNRLPKIRQSSNELNLNSAEYSSEMDSKHMPNVKGPTEEGYLLNSFEERDTQPTENSSFTIISVPDDNNEYDVTENASTHSRKLIEQENINSTTNSPVITPTPLGKDFSEDWQKNNFRFMHSVEQLDTTEALQNNDTPPVTKKSSFQFENSFEVLKDSVLMDSKNNNQDQKDIPGEDNFFKENELTVAKEYEYNATIREISKNKTKEQTSFSFTTEPKTKENSASDMSFRSISKPQDDHQRNNYQINKTLSSESLILVENLDLTIADRSSLEETTPTTEFYLRSDYPNLEILQSENTLSDYHLQPVPAYPEFYTTIKYSEVEQGDTGNEANATIDKSQMSGSNPVAYTHGNNSWNKAAYDSILNNESTNNFNKTISTRSAVSTHTRKYSSYDYSTISTTEGIEASDELQIQPQNNGKQSSSFQIISKDHISMTEEHTENPTEHIETPVAELIKTSRHNKHTKNNKTKERSMDPFNLISKPNFVNYDNNDTYATEKQIEQQEKHLKNEIKDVERIINNENIFSESYVTIPNIVTRELQNNTVLSSLSDEHLHDQDFLHIGTPAVLDSNAPETDHINQKSLSGKLFFIFDKVSIPARFVQKENGEISMGIDGDTLCAKLNSDYNKSLLISSLCNGLFNNNCSSSILPKI